MTPTELSNHALTHIPFHPGCRSCVAGRKRDHQHPRRSGVEQMQHDLDAANAHVSADYFFPKDAPGHKGVTAIAIRDRETKFLAGHVVEQKGAGQQGAVKQLLQDLRKMGHHDKVVIRTDQEISIIDLFKRVAKDRGASKTMRLPLEATPKQMGKEKTPFNLLNRWREHLWSIWKSDAERSYQWTMRSTHG